MEQTKEPDETMPIGRIVVRKKVHVLGRSWRLSSFVVVRAIICVTIEAKIRCIDTNKIAFGVSLAYLSRAI